MEVNWAKQVKQSCNTDFAKNSLMFRNELFIDKDWSWPQAAACTKGSFTNYVDSKGKEASLNVNILLSKAVNQGEGGQKSPKIGQRSLWTTPKLQ